MTGGSSWRTFQPKLVPKSTGPWFEKVHRVRNPKQIWYKPEADSFYDQKYRWVFHKEVYNVLKIEGFAKKLKQNALEAGESEHITSGDPADFR